MGRSAPFFNIIFSESVFINLRTVSIFNAISKKCPVISFEGGGFDVYEAYPFIGKLRVTSPMLDKIMTMSAL